MAQWVSACTVLAEDWSSDSRIEVGWLATAYSSFRGVQCPWSPCTPVLKYTYPTPTQHIERVKQNKLKSLKHWVKMLKKLPEDGIIARSHWLTGLILWKWAFHQKQSTDSMKAQSKFQCNSSQKLI